jgi:hypothetical protein
MFPSFDLAVVALESMCTTQWGVSQAMKEKRRNVFEYDALKQMWERPSIEVGWVTQSPVVPPLYPRPSSLPSSLTI